MLKFASWLLIIATTSTIGYSQCNHRHGFERSAVADSIDAIHYHIHLRNIEFSLKRIFATATITLRPKVTLSRIPLELKALIVDSVKINNLNTTFTRQGDVLRLNGLQQYEPTDTVVVKVFYGGAPFSEQWGGFHFSGNYAFNLGVGFVSNPHNLGKAWFPCVDDFQDRATYEVLVTLPQAMTGISGGLLIATTQHDDGTKTWHWKYGQAIPTYLVSVAAGTYALKADTYLGLQNTLPITIYTRPADTAKVNGSFLNLKHILSQFENRFGPYPFDRVGYTGTAIGAMEHVSNIAYPHSAINGNLSSEYLLAHELSHMWFGNLVTCATEGDMWLNEGWATFCHHYFRNNLYSPSAYRAAMNETIYNVLRNAHITDGSYLSLRNVPTQYTYGTTVYDKGATVVHTLMNYLGENLFFSTVRAYLQRFAYSHANSYDMRDFMSAYTGINLVPFFDAWVFTPGTPHFNIDSMRVTPSGNQFKTQIFLRQKYKGFNNLANNNILEITFLDANWQKHTDTVHFSGRNGQSTKWLNFNPKLVLPDYYDKIADARTDADGVIRSTGQLSFPKMNVNMYVDALPDTAFYRLTHHWAAPDSLKSIIPGLRLSPYRYWELKGIFPANTAMRARFFYSNATALDASLIRTERDSVVLLYRATPAHEWQTIPQQREGLWMVGYIWVNNFLPGEYTLAVWDKQLVSTSKNWAPALKQALRVMPNPAKNYVLLKWEEVHPGQLTIVDIEGKTIFTKQIKHETSLRIDTRLWENGMYFADLLSKKGLNMGFAKIIIQNN